MNIRIYVILHVLLELEDGGKAIAHDGVVVNDEYLQFGGHGFERFEGLGFGGEMGEGGGCALVGFAGDFKCSAETAGAF